VAGRSASATGADPAQWVDAVIRRVPIRIKLAAALAVPLVALGVVTLVEVVSVARDAREVREQTSLAIATIGPNGLITALQNERNWMSAHLVGVDQTLELEVTGYDRTRGDTDAALAQFERELDRRGDVARAAYAPALDGLGALAALRGEIDTIATTTTLTLGNIGPTTELFDRYTALIEPFFRGTSRISFAINDTELRQGAALTETVTRQLETVPQLANALVLPATIATADGDVAGINSPAEVSKVARLYSTFRVQADVLRSATGQFAPIAEEHYPEEFNQNLDAQAAQALTTGQIDVDFFLSDLDVASVDLAYVGYRDGIAGALEDRADELNATATNRQRLFGLLASVTFLSAVVFTALVSLSITRPLRALKRQATDMADHRLPEAVADILGTPLGEDVAVPTVTPVRVATRDEVADVAEALNTVQDSALDLAVEQAVLRRNIADSFVNLGRRNQNLLGRQLDFITELEARETDSVVLANLFRLDHLATRMRRNAESLLVLAGIEPARQLAAPVRLTDVIRAALGEVEDYQRVTVHDVEPATVVGAIAADLAHLLAELIENALVFSPPDQRVDIRGRHRATHGAEQPGDYTLVITDAGLGMPPEDIASANRRLAGAESFTIAPSKYLGHYVAANLALRHGIHVELHSSPNRGITATVSLPSGLLVADAGRRVSPGPPPADGRTAAPPLPRTRAPHVPGRLGPSPVAPRPPGHAPSTPPVTAPIFTAPTADQLASFTRVAQRGRTPRQPTMPPGAGAPPPLARRDPGAHMPATEPLGVRHTPPASAPHDPDQPPPWVPPADQARHAAADVYTFLSSFTAGIQRGLDDARDRRMHPPDHPS
jgi:signal transduction histidine kinase